jgi:RNA polymerase sigma-70 factor (ECF subfamily)
VAQVVKEEWPRLMATLYRDLGDLGAAEDAAQEAATLALTKWLDDGIPDKPGAWITTVARRKAVDRIRRERTGRDKTELLGRLEEPLADAAPADDDQLGLFFGCCHPALSIEAQVALTLRSLGGLTTAEIARGFLVPEATMAQRIVRAKRKIASAAIPFRIPDESEMIDRLGVVHQVLYLVFNEGAYPTTGSLTSRVDLAEEATRLAELLAELMVDDAESLALHSLFLMIQARRSARLAGAGEVVRLPHQNRRLWSQTLIREGQDQLDRAIRLERPGPYQVEAAIQSLHNEAATADATDWVQIAALYRRLSDWRPTPVVALNHAVAVGEADGPAAAMAILDDPMISEPLADYPHYHSTRADVLRRLGRNAEAAAEYRLALATIEHHADRRFLERRLGEVSS